MFHKNVISISNLYRHQYTVGKCLWWCCRGISLRHELMLKIAKCRTASRTESLNVGLRDICNTNGLLSNVVLKAICCHAVHLPGVLVSQITLQLRTFASYREKWDLVFCDTSNTLSDMVYLYHGLTKGHFLGYFGVPVLKWLVTQKRVVVKWYGLDLGIQGD